MAPLSLFLAINYHRVSNGYTKLLTLQGNPRTSVSRKREVGRRKCFFLFFGTLCDVQNKV